MHDLVIRGGKVVDGSGAPARVADVAVDGDTIRAVGGVGAGRREVDADGALVAPGWVDIHTHYDGQATWDGELAPSSHHGVTTIVMGNCGVGFAPVRPGTESFLIELMEGVEDIPGPALHAGMDWRWESFDEYLAALESRPRTLDVAAQVAHSAVRAYVLGERAHANDLSDAEIVEMAAVVREGIEAGAFGFSTSQTRAHTSRHGLVPGTFAFRRELVAIAQALADAGHGVFQCVSDETSLGNDAAVFDELCDTGVPITFSVAQMPREPWGFRESLDHARDSTAAGRPIAPQVPARPTGMLYGLQSSFHPFISHPSFEPLLNQPLERVVAELRRPELRARLLTERQRFEGTIWDGLARVWSRMFKLGDPPDYEPPREASVQAAAEREGRRPEEVLLDWLLEDEGRAFVFAPLGSYYAHDLEAVREMLEHPAAVVGLSDGGAHCALICDASFPTYLLAHWTRDRTRGPRLPLERVVHLQTQAPARTYGLHDRGRIAPGLRADFNLIDYPGLKLHAPQMVFDLPGDARRLIQRADGYRMTFQSGVQTFADGEPTGARPGRTLRAGPRGPGYALHAPRA